MPLCPANVGIGGTLQQEVEKKAEINRQKSIRCTEEVVRREEAQKRETELTRAKEEWKREKQQFFIEAHHSQLRAIAKETDILEKTLRREFEEDLAKVRAECKNYVEITVQATLQEADKVREQAVIDARHEEQYLAQQEAWGVAEEVSENKRREKEEADEEKCKALADLTEHMNVVCLNALAEKQRDMEEEFAVRMSEIQRKNEDHVSNLEEQLREVLANNSTLTSKLQETTESRDIWKGKHEDLKIEFSDFIDQFPGFRGEFILK